MPPPRTGSVEQGRRADGRAYFRARIRLADGSRERVDVPEKYCTPAGGLTARQRAEHYAQAVQEREDESGAMLKKKQERSAAGKVETWDVWFERHLAAKECGESYRRISGHVASKWISPVIGTKAVAALTRDDVEDVRDRLDLALDAKEIRHATARNIWSTFVSALKAAYDARDRSLRVLTAPIHFGIKPPKRGHSRQRPWLHPREWLALVNCALVPLEMRQICCLAMYTGLRPGELRALKWSDVDLVGRTISVSKAIDAETMAEKPPKTAAGQRTIPILDALLPLLQTLEGEPNALVIGAFRISEDHIATSFRTALAVAGIKRPRLTADNDTEEPADFRTLRDSHATWLALDGVADKIIQRRLGHANPATTDAYVKVAEIFSKDNVGPPFPPLPKEVWAGIGPSWKNQLKTSTTLVARVGFEPTTFGL